MQRGGEIIVLDTGSTDGSAEYCRSNQAKVFEAGDRFVFFIDTEQAADINQRFIVAGEAPAVAAGDRLFAFAQARNYGAGLAAHDWVSWADSDEAFTAFDIEAIEAAVTDPRNIQCEYEFCFAHHDDGSPDVAFRQCKMYDRRRMEWRGIVHEVLGRKDDAPGEKVYLPEPVLHLEHWQMPSPHRQQYLVGLALDCFLHPDKDRQSHYFARELFYTRRYRSAILEFKRHVAMNRWPAERAQSLIYMGDCYGCLGDAERQVRCYYRAFHIDSHRREALLRLAGYYKFYENRQATACFAAAAMEIPWSGTYYADRKADYLSTPQELLAWAKGEVAVGA